MAESTGSLFPWHKSNQGLHAKFHIGCERAFHLIFSLSLSLEKSMFVTDIAKVNRAGVLNLLLQY